MTGKTSLHAAHLKASARMTDFAGWDMPLHYGSQISEHHVVRQSAGVFDVSHMGIVDFNGKEALRLLQYLLSADAGRLTPGTALYCCLLNHSGGIKDDLIVYRLGETAFRLVINAGTRDKDLAWFREHAHNRDVTLTEQTELAMLAIQGPAVAEKITTLFPVAFASQIAALLPFSFATHGKWMVARTGYTGEEGFEVILPAEEAPAFWDTLLAAGIQPCGLGARDTLRLEAGLNLYGTDMDETVSPLEAGLAWTVSLEDTSRDFIGRQALLDQRAKGVTLKRVGVVANPRTVLRNHQPLHTDNADHGMITSGSFSPTLGLGIALARVPVTAGSTGTVTVRGKPVSVTLIRPPFVRHGNKCF